MISKELAEANFKEGARFLGEGRPDAAKVLLGALAKFFPDDPNVLHAFGVSLSRTDDKHTAVEMFRKARALNPANADTALCLAADLHQLQRTEEATGVVCEVLARQPRNLGANYLLGTLLFDQQSYRESLDQLARVLEINPFVPEVWAKRGRALLALDQPARAMEAFVRSLALNPATPEANAGLGEAILRLPGGSGVYLLVQGGIGDFLQCLPYLHGNHGRLPRLVVLSHFRGAPDFFAGLGIEVAEHHHFSNPEEMAHARSQANANGQGLPCPRSAFFTRSPFPPKELAFTQPRLTLAVHLAGSAFSVDLQRRNGLVSKSLPIEVLHRIRDLNRYNIIMFGSRDELGAMAIEESADLRLANFGSISESLGAVAQCAAFVGSDSAIKSMSAMLRIPSLVWLGDYPDPYRDAVFVDPYVRAGCMRVFRYRDPLRDIDAGVRFTEQGLAHFGFG